MTGPAREAEPDRTAVDARGTVCLGCGCLCDDLTVVLEEDRVVSFGPECAIGRRWFESVAAIDTGPDCVVEGEPAGPDVALQRAAEVLQNARRPALYGLSQTTTEAVRDALSLADRLRALVLLARSEADLARVSAFQRLGRVTSTLGEVRERADLIVFWGWDPVSTHPRHGERYSFEAPGRSVPGGRSDRTIVVIDDRPNATARVADLTVPLAPDDDASLATGLHWAVRDQAADLSRVARACRLDVSVVAALVDRVRAARYGAVFFQPRCTSGPEARAAWDGVTALVRELNGPRRFVLLSPGAGGDLAGAEAALTWQAGFLQGVDYRAGFPAPVDDRATLESALASGEIDALLIVSDELPEALSAAERARLDAIPTVAIGRGATGPAAPRATVALAAAACGVEVAGSVTRVDGVSLPLRPLRPARRPTDREWLGRLAGLLGEDPGASACAPSGSGRARA